MSAFLAWLVKKIVSVGVSNIASGIVVAVLLGFLWWLWGDYQSAKAEVITLRHMIVALENTLNETRLTATMREEQLQADLDAAVSALRRRHEIQTETAKVVTVVKTIERPANEEKLCPPHPALVYAFDSLRAEAAGAARHNATQAGDDNAPR